MIRHLAVAAAFALSACGTVTQPPPPPAPTIICAPLKAYTPAEEKALGTAVAALQADNPIVGAIVDYGQMRAAARACAAK